MDETTGLKTVAIQTHDGPVVGYINEQLSKTQYIFKGIPYAKPPLGNLRFKAPAVMLPWNDARDCTKDSQIGYAMIGDTPHGHPIIIGSEDCLYVDVATPDLKPVKPLPVMFWIGTCGYSYTLDPCLDPTPLLNEDVICIRCGFRIGVFGFLSINDLSAPGNVGLKDIVLALKWVQRNITGFGGDPNNITIYGNSSGGALVHLLVLSSMASGLFHKAIIQSGSALNNWSLVKNPVPSVMELAHEVGIITTCPLEAVEKLTLIPAETIMQACIDISFRNQEREPDNFDSLFKPCIEEAFEGQPAFLTKSPLSILKSGKFNKVPIIIGSNNLEAMLYDFCRHDFFKNYDKYNQDTGLIVPRALAGEVTKSKKIGQQIIEFYIGEDSLSANNKTEFLQLLSDYYFLYYVNKAVRVHCQHEDRAPIYYYILNNAPQWDVPQELRFLNSLGHLSEISYVYEIKKLDKTFCKGSKESITTRRRVVKMWTNFAKYGNPTPDDSDPLLQITWDPVENPERLNFLCIGIDLTKGRNPFHERMKFWDKLHEEHVYFRAIVHFSDMGVRW